MTEAYPLHWPEGWPRTDYSDQQPQIGAYADIPTFGTAVDRLLNELRLLGAENVVISTDEELRLDGRPKASGRPVRDPGVAVYFVYLDGKQMMMAQDRYCRIEENIRSLALAIEGMRRMERHGGATMMDRAFTGFAALPPADAPRERDWWDVLGLDPQRCDRFDVEAACKRKSLTAHPDNGGTDAAMAELNRVRTVALDAV